MHGLKGILWLQARNRLYNNHFPASHPDYYIDGAQEEIREIRESLASGDRDGLELEVGDLLWDVLSLINKLDHEGLIDMHRVCPRAVAKFAERMPYNVEGYLQESAEGRQDIWENVKKLQKTRGLDENHPLVVKVWAGSVRGGKIRYLNESIS